MALNQLSRRDFLRLSALGTASTMLAACAVAPAAAPSAGGAQAPAAATVNLQFWSEGAHEWAEEQIALYMEQNPAVTVEYVTFKSQEMTPKLLTASAAGTAPNLTRQDRFRVAGWAGRGGAEPLTAYMEQYSVDPSVFWPATWEECQWQGVTYAIPFNTDGRYVFWNKDIFAAAGLDPETPPPTHDWEAMIDLAVSLTQRESDGVVNVMGFIPSQVLSNAYGNGGDYLYVWANRGSFLIDDRTASLDSPELQQVLQWQKDIVDAVGGIDVAAEFNAGWPTTAGFSPFGAGKLAMMVNGDWNIGDFARYYPDLNFGMAPWEIRNSPGEYTGFAGGFSLAIPAGAASLDETYRLLDFLASYDSQLSASIRYQFIPARKDAALSEELLASSSNPAQRKMANESMEYAHFRPVTPVAGEIHSYWVRPGTARDWVLYGEKDVATACKDMQEAIQKALDEYWVSIGA
ncbi:MAG: extracellular solute-binding protein [Caldilineaceae bacterium]|nr:extracellular solute-binding protein [Caldilineaceae bacterium]